MRKVFILVMLLCAAMAFAASPMAPGAPLARAIRIFAAPVAQPSAHGILWTWPQSPTPGITANTFYCGTVSGTYTLVWTFSAPTTTFDWLTTDSIHPPVQGQKYFCAVTASTGGVPGIESGFSPETPGTFPVVPLPPPGLSQAPH